METQSSHYTRTLSPRLLCQSRSLRAIFEKNFGEIGNCSTLSYQRPSGIRSWKNILILANFTQVLNKNLQRTSVPPVVCGITNRPKTIPMVFKQLPYYYLIMLLLHVTSEKHPKLLTDMSGALENARKPGLSCDSIKMSHKACPDSLWRGSMEFRKHGHWGHLAKKLKELTHKHR